MNKNAIFWFRRDLRLEDNKGLHEALNSGMQVIPLFIFDSRILFQLEDTHDRRVDFISQALQQLAREIAERGGHLVVRHGDPCRVLNELCDNNNIGAVYTNRDYEPYALRRDREVEALLQSKTITFHTFKDQVIFEPEEIKKEDGSPYKVYTPYSKVWKKLLNQEFLTSVPSDKSREYAKGLQDEKNPGLEDIGFQATGIRYTVPELPESIISNYHLTRDLPSIEGTSRISVHLRFGTISIRKVVKKALELNETWLGELIWREFFMMILNYFPHVEHQSFKPAYDAIAWKNNEQEFERWCSGTTGFPIVDAGMRELKATGFMHNRVRMITAGFLTKQLLIDWRWGEAWFARHLIDYELSSNNGNWQWAAGSGCDAAPYFRIFNPYEQTKKFDPRLEYVGKWIPELTNQDYPQPIVEHSTARLRALEVYKKSLKEY